VDGVGSGALKEADVAAGADIDGLITWQRGQPVPYAFLADTLETISSTTKRLEMTRMLVRAGLGYTLAAVSMRRMLFTVSGNEATYCAAEYVNRPLSALPIVLFKPQVATCALP
jgi:hypothetical protein